MGPRRPERLAAPRGVSGAPSLSLPRHIASSRKFSPTARALYVVITRFQWADGVVPVKRRRSLGINDVLGMSFSAGGRAGRPDGS